MREAELKSVDSLAQLVSMLLVPVGGKLDCVKWDPFKAHQVHAKDNSNHH